MKIRETLGSVRSLVLVANLHLQGNSLSSCVIVKYVFHIQMFAIILVLGTAISPLDSLEIPKKIGDPFKSLLDQWTKLRSIQSGLFAGMRIFEPNCLASNV